MVKILITSKNSYIGNSFYNFIIENYKNEYIVDKKSLRENNLNDLYLNKYDVVLHVAGIAHSDYWKISKEKSKKYYDVNTLLTSNLAKIAKKNNVKQFIFLSSIIVYGDSAPIGVKKIINKYTIPNPQNAYGDSKLKAENNIKFLNDNSFKVAILRLPMVYGNNCKGNYKMLERIAMHSFVFPYVDNEKSVININKLCQFIKKIIDNSCSGIFFPQDENYMNTSEMVKKLRIKNGKNIYLIRGCSFILKFISLFIPLINKAFGNLVYDKKLSNIDF